MPGKCKISLMLVLFLLLFSTGNVSAQAEDLKVGFIYVGPVGDAGWSFAHNEGRLYLQDYFPGITTSYVEAVPEGADAERVITQFARQGYDLIFTTSFGYMDSTANVAQRFPQTYFEHCSGYRLEDNMSNYFGRMYEPRFLSGMVAGAMTETNILGYVAAFPIPEVIRGINAFTLGAQYVNPDVTVKVVWTNTWYDPSVEKSAAIALLDSNCDVIAQHQDTPAPMQAAEERGKYGISYNSVMSQYAPEAILTGPIWNWGPYYVNRVYDVINGTWEADSYWGGMDDGIVDLAPFGPMVPQDVIDMVEAKKMEIIAGDFHVFAGPLYDNRGELRVAEGVTLTDGEMLSIEWFVAGVQSIQ